METGQLTDNYSQLSLIQMDLSTVTRATEITTDLKFSNNNNGLYIS